MWEYKDIKLIIKGKYLIMQLPFWALIKRGKKGIIRIRKLSNGGNLIKERWELMVKSKVKIVKSNTMDSSSCVHTVHNPLCRLILAGTCGVPYVFLL